jgi:hypothetical protein
MGKAHDITGQKFGRLTALSRDVSKNYVRPNWICRCDCGELIIRRNSQLINGSIQSCGCLQKELASKRLVTHGRSNSKTYRSWAAMKARCYNPLHHAYENYGGRGISVDPTWLTSFQTFVEDMGERPSNTTLDRIDNESGYSKVNCRWATKVEQGNNTRCNVVLEFQGESKTATEWAKDLNISYYALIKRISDYKWSVERALTTPLQKRTKRGS